MAHLFKNSPQLTTLLVTVPSEKIEQVHRAATNSLGTEPEIMRCDAPLLAIRRELEGQINVLPL